MINIIDEAVATGLLQGVVEGSSQTIAASLMMTLSTGAIFGTSGFITGFTAGFGQGVLEALRQGAIGGAQGFLTGAVKGFTVGGVYAISIGCVAGVAIGVVSGCMQYESLKQTQKMDSLLVSSIEVFSKFAAGELDYDRARDQVAVIINKANELFPDEESRIDVPVYRACSEVQYVLRGYGRRQQWL